MINSIPSDQWYVKSQMIRFKLQGSYSPNGAISEMYGSIGGHYSSHYGNLNFSGAGDRTNNAPAWRGSQHYIHWKYVLKRRKKYYERKKNSVIVRTY